MTVDAGPCHRVHMAMEELVAGLAVADCPRAREWWGRLFGRDVDVVAHDREVLWRVAGTVGSGRRGRRARRSRPARHQGVEETVADLGARGIAGGAVTRRATAREAVVTDPDGDEFAFIDVAGG
ncbi:hypothetical protein ACI79C_13820 [Geodermatophilus sp. SYSU D00697]